MVTPRLRIRLAIEQAMDQANIKYRGRRSSPDIQMMSLGSTEFVCESTLAT